MRILAVNCGSSSLKAALFEADPAACEMRATAAVESIGGRASLRYRAAGGEEQHQALAVRDYGQALDAALGQLAGADRVEAVGHRVVQGGRLVEPVLIDHAVLAIVSEQRRLAPLHNGPALDGIRAARERFPGTPMIAVFDTAFHASMPAMATRYALPDEVSQPHGIRRYGYHGIAHRSMTERYAELTGAALSSVTIITLQLGNGCSAAAVRAGVSVDTTMGFSPVEGLMMGTRPGDVDPAAVVYLQREGGMSPEQIDNMLNHRSGLLGVSGRTADMRELLEAEAAGDERAHLAIEMFCYRVRKCIGAYAAVLGEPQAVVFGGGIGERAAAVRRRICEPLRPLGLAIDLQKNAALAGEGRFDVAGSKIAVYVIPSNEERTIARDTFDLLQGKE